MRAALILAAVTVGLTGCGFQRPPGGSGTAAPAGRAAETAADLVARLPPPPAESDVRRPDTPGVVVFDLSASPEERDLAVGASRWLQLAVGGRPSCGQTPQLFTLRRLAREQQPEGLAVEPGVAHSLARRVGATHAVTGSLRRDGPRYEVVLQAAAVGEQQGARLVAAGTEAELPAVLTRLAGDLLAHLRVTERPPPAPPAAVLRDVGAAWWGPWRPDRARRLRLSRAAPRWSIAALADLADTGPDDLTAARVAVLAKGAGAEPLVLGEVGYWDAGSLPPGLPTLVKQHPGNLALAHCQVWRLRNRRQYAAELPAVRAALRCAPANPDIWLTLAQTVGDEAERLRRGRTVGQISEAEWATLRPLYADWLRAAGHAVRLDPQHAGAWVRVARAATFEGHPIAADALWLSLDLDPRDVGAYEWGLQMFQPKWLDDAAALERVAQQAALQDWSPFDVEGVVGALETAKQAAALTQLAERLAPKLADYPYLRGRLLETAGRPGAAAAYREAIRRQSGDAESRWRLARLIRDNEPDEALRLFAEAVRLDPSSGPYRYDYGILLQDLGRTREAEQQMRAAVAANPDYGPAHHVLGQLLVGDGKLPEGIRHLRRAVALVGSFAGSRKELAHALLRNNELAAGAEAAEAALQAGGDDVAVLNMLGHAYGKLGRLDESIEASRRALALQPEDAIAHVNLAEALLRKGERAEGARELDLAEELGDSDIVAEARRMRKRYLR
jgi:tetratricopeptide (TPR) repeat protein